MRGLSARSRITFGLVGLTTSLLLVAAMMDLIPDRNGALRDGRAAVAEVLAASSTQWIADGDLKKAEATIRLAVNRNEDLLSAALRDRLSRVVLAVSEHEAAWTAMTGSHSTDTQLRVPILTMSGQKWGQLELRFRPLAGTGVEAWIRHPMTQLLGFMFLAGFCGYYFYLSKALAQLDPSKAIPGRVRSALDSIAEGLLIIDRSGRAVLANRAFAGWVGKAPDALIGMIPRDLPWVAAHGAEPAAADMPWTRSLNEAVEVDNVMLYLRGGDGVRRALKVNSSPVLAANGRPGGVLVSFDDVTQIERQGEQLREAKDEAEAASRAKSEFLANMSHEIRTPMNAILGFTDVLRRGYSKDEREARTHLDTIHSSGTHLLELINDILDLSKVEAGRMEVERVPFTPHQAIRDVIRVLGVRAEEKGIGLEFEAETPLPESVLSDPGRFRQILTNLLGNAIKFTEHGSVRVVARLADAGTPHPALEVDVVDSGVGIAPDKLDAIFNPFEQEDGSVVRRFGGTGLGLAISRKFARALDGDITVASEPGVGSTFRVRLSTGPLDGVPLCSAEEIAAITDEPATVEREHWQFSPARVLVVDDGVENRRLLEVVLGDAGLTMDEAENGQVAVDLAAQRHYDVILMDMQMPVMDGYTATRTLRAQGVESPIVALTAHAMKGFEEQCYAAGCTAYVTKPVNIDVLFETLSRWLDARLEQADSAQQPVQPVPLADGAAGVGEPVTSRLAGNPRFLPIIKDFTERLESRLREAMSAIEAGDMDALAQFGHWLKGSGGTVGFDAFTDTAAEMEAAARAGDTDGVREHAGHVADLARRIELPASEAPAPGSDERRDAATPSVSLVEAAPAPVAADPGPVVSRLADNPRFAPIVAAFVDRLRAQLPELDAALERSDFQRVAELAHWLRGSAGTVGFDAFTEPADELEERARAGDGASVSRIAQRLMQLAARIEQPPAGAERPAQGAAGA